MKSLSVIIITKNVAHDIRKCLESIKWADEIIVLDSGSTDETVAICKEYTANVFSTDWPGFGPQKNRALAKATQDWVLSIDADEWVNLDLHNEILDVLSCSNPPYDAYWVPRLSQFCGRIIRYGSWRGDKVIRLFKRNTAKFSDDIVHERLIPTGNTGELDNYLLHNPYKNLNEVVAKMNLYSTAGAIQKHQSNKNGGLGKALLRGLWAFIKSYFVKRGFLDGKEGFILAVSIAEGSYYRYLKLMYLNRTKHEAKDKTLTWP